MKKLISTILFIFLIEACASSPTVRFMRYTSEEYPPTANVEVLQIKPVTRPFKELGILSIRVKKSTNENTVLYLKDRARGIGADAIVMLGEVSAGAVAMPVGNMAVAVPIRDLQALAIRYER